MKTFTKLFTESRYERRPEGAAPDSWEHVSHTAPIDEQVEVWATNEGANIINVSAPGISQLWANKEMTLKCIIVAYVVIYIPRKSE
jgi:hypothetical protein